MAIDAQIPLMVRPVADPMEGMGRAMSLAALAQQGRLQQVQLEQAQREQDEQRSLADLYRGAIGADGKLDRSAVLQGAASRGLGAKIPALQKGWVEADKAQAELDASQVKTEVEKAKFVSDMVSRLASNPNATRDDVMRELQAAPPQFAQNAAGFARMLPTDPQQLRQFLLTAGASADKRIELLTPKLQAFNTGKETVFRDMNTVTNPGGPGTLQMTTTPDADLSATTSRRGQDIAAATAAAGRAQAERHFQTQQQNGDRSVTYQTLQDGTIVALPSRAAPGQSPAGAPVLGADGKPLQGKAERPPEAYLKGMSGVNELRNAVANYRVVLEKNGGPNAMATGAARGELKSAFTAMQMAMKNAMELGALAGPDVDILNGLIIDPTSMKADFVLKGPGMNAQLQQVDKFLDNKESILSGTYQAPNPMRGKQPAAALTPAVAAPAAPKLGAVDGGYLYTGGDPANPKSWQKVK